jgi:transposase-like protein
MRRKNGVRRQGITYSEAFKISVVRELEDSDISFDAIRRKYGIRGCGVVQRWARKYGRGDIGKIIRVETPKEINEREEMKRRIKALEKALADAHVDLAIEKACSKILGKRAGIEDLAEFKKKVGGK